MTVAALSVLWWSLALYGTAVRYDADVRSSWCADHEVVGASGRIGSSLLTDGARAVPRGASPGSFSAPGAPLYVAVPSAEWDAVAAATPADRRGDLVLVGNGLPSLLGDEHNVTLVVPCFAVLERNGPVVVRPNAPATVAWGRHAETAAALLRRVGGVRATVVRDRNEAVRAAVRKLVWSSTLWLLCHDDDDGGRPFRPRTVREVHDDGSSRRDLERLVVDELVPAANHRLTTEFGAGSLDADDVLRYMKQYSYSIPDAVPSTRSALDELETRNGFFIKVRDAVPQPRHEKLLRRWTTRSSTSSSSIEDDDDDDHDRAPRVRADVPELGMTFWGRPLRRTTIPRKKKTVVVVGSGVLGTSCALHLSRRTDRVERVVVCDVASDDDGEDDSSSSSSSSPSCGSTTPASWAWLNANSKSPDAYRWLNQLGMDGWRRDPVLRDLPSWPGALVRYPKHKASSSSSSSFRGYLREGPLDAERIREIEPRADLTDDENETSETYFFPQEGCVDPRAAVEAMRREAVASGVVQFVGNVRVADVATETREDGTVVAVGVTYARRTNDDDDDEEEEETGTWDADAVVLAAGVGTGALGGLPLDLDRKGTVVFVENDDDDDDDEKETPTIPDDQQQQQPSPPRSLRILVDTVREAHVLQRRDGTVAIGGGRLQTGGEGTESDGDDGDGRNVDDEEVSLLLDGARRLLSGDENSSSLLSSSSSSSSFQKRRVRSASAVRPMPADGLPIVGRDARNGAYALVSHSGVTLAPILGAIAAAEIALDAEIDTLRPFRPSRFFETNTTTT